eukprot:scaffold1724_cov341-Pavlova_lutheri.AAC.67
MQQANFNPGRIVGAVHSLARCRHQAMSSLEGCPSWTIKRQWWLGMRVKEAKSSANVTFDCELFGACVHR